MTSKKEVQDPWEILEVPAVINFSSKSNEDEGEENDFSQNNSKTKKDNKERLCGYLNKMGAGIIKGWKKRWFVYDPRRCLLFYYRRPQDTEPLGTIDIASATFSYNPNVKALFSISSGDRLYQLEAPDNNAMMFWLQELQAKRREFSKLVEANAGNNRPTSGLLSDPIDAPQGGDDEADGFNKIIERPHNVGEKTALDSKGNFSFTHLNKEFKNWRKSTFYTETGEAILNEKSAASTPEQEKKSPNMQRREDDTKILESGNKRRVDFGFSKMVANLRNTNMPVISSPQPNNNNINQCRDCMEKLNMVKTLQEAISMAEKEITTRDEVIESISEQLRFASSSPTLVEKAPDIEEAEERELYILKLSRMIKSLNEKVDELTTTIRENERTLEEYEQKERVLKEMIHAKDNSIIALTNQVFSLEEKETTDVAQDVLIAFEEKPSEMTDSNSSPIELDYDQLKEACSAYQAQNNFLNSEILELHKLRTLDAEKILNANDNLEMKEAEVIKIRSRYLWLLKDCAGPKRETNMESDGVLEKLIDEAINEKADSTTEKKSPTEIRFADKYGFYDQIEKSDENALESLADHFESLSGDKELGSLEVSHGVKWENYLVAQGTAPLQKTEELKALVRSGIPHEFRARVWGDLVRLRSDHERTIAGQGYYANLLKEKKGAYSPSAKQIELDLLRTLPNNKYYDTLESEGISKLRRILTAYSWHNPAVGYCQGLNRLGAIALLYLDEETAFWCLVAITEHLMPIDYYSRTLLGAQIDQKVFRDLLDEKCPKLSAHLVSLQFDISLVSFNWFLTVFVDLFPIELTLRVWDTFLFEGSKVLFRYALSVFKLFEEEFLRFKDPGPMFNFFRNLPKKKFNIQKICYIAFNTMNPFSRRNVESKRKFYRPVLQAQLDEFEIMREEYKEKREDSISIHDEEPISDDEN
ncbi:TBC1 domain family member 2B-like isoform X1 [Clytia hemisphaerica]|uniref:TBC1 domain family member 2B n=1 Tax=Clytia hemisphaerica TaxID=252671 RepID=A0A7M5WRJ0_9CNID